MSFPTRTQAQESRTAISRMYVTMRHLFNRGYYKPNGASGRSLRDALNAIKPEIYGSIADQEKVELDGLVYILDRLPVGIEECRFVKLIADEGYRQTGMEVIIPSKRRRNCYRLDRETMLIEVTRGRSEIYDILTHLTFMYLEANKIARNARDHDGNITHEWMMLERIVCGPKEAPAGQAEDMSFRHQAFSYLSTLLGRTFQEATEAYERLEGIRDYNHGLFNTIYWLGKMSMEEEVNEEHERTVKFTSTLRDWVGHHIHGERWANNIQEALTKQGWQDRPLHIISANLHSVRNCLYGIAALKEQGVSTDGMNLYGMAELLSSSEGQVLNQSIQDYAEKHGMLALSKTGGTNIEVQLFDTSALSDIPLPTELNGWRMGKNDGDESPILLVMDYAFGEQAFEVLDELLKPYDVDEKAVRNIPSISIMGKAGTLVGGKGDLMIPTAHVFEGTADNYPFENDITLEDFEGCGIPAAEGAMVTVLGTSLQNKEILKYFKDSSWAVIGIEMEGAHYQKAIQAAAHIRKSIQKEVKVRYAYYSSDNPLITGATLASGSLGMVGVRPTYLITVKFLEKILK